MSKTLRHRSMNFRRRSAVYSLSWTSDVAMAIVTWKQKIINNHTLKIPVQSFRSGSLYECIWRGIYDSDPQLNCFCRPTIFFQKRQNLFQIYDVIYKHSLPFLQSIKFANPSKQFISTALEISEMLILVYILNIKRPNFLRFVVNFRWILTKFLKAF